MMAHVFLTRAISEQIDKSKHNTRELQNLHNTAATYIEITTYKTCYFSTATTYRFC